ncbi:hypothetical protein HY407_04345 [Candidatus Gottesmanbacteria bacterium]|nr:hypothetical protein [Candidatus Gottesmanbacteria bacterium]
MPKKQLPEQFYKYFWDIDVTTLDTSKNSLFIINRLLDKGDDAAIRWIRDQYPNNLIKKALTSLRGFSPKIANFWGLFLGIPKDKILCLQTPYLKRRSMHWSY